MSRAEKSGDPSDPDLTAAGEARANAAKRIVVCWHPGNIPSLMHTLRTAGGNYPDPWNPSI